MRIYRLGWLSMATVLALLPLAKTPAQDPSPRPNHAISLFDGKDLSAWTIKLGDIVRDPPPAPAWPIEMGLLKVEPGAKSLGTRQGFGAMHLHLEYKIPAPSPKATKPPRLSAAVILPDESTLLIGNSFAEDGAPHARSACGINGAIAADRNAARPPEVWQSLDIQWKPLPNDNGDAQWPELRVHWNGVLVHDDVRLVKEGQKPSGLPSGAGSQLGLEAREGTAYFRNIWVVDERPSTEAPGVETGPIKLHPFFQDHMVLQRQRPITIWGTASKGAAIQVSLGDSPGVATKSNDQGKWSAQLPGQPAGGPFELVVSSGDQKLVCHDVLIGDLWLASGQSNMRWPIRRTDSAKEILARADVPQLRLGTVPRTPKPRAPQSTVPVSWKVSSAEAAKDFSAVGWHFGRHLQSALNIPIGIMHSSVGGTPVEAWMPASALEKDAVLELYAEQKSKAQAAYRRRLRKWRTQALKAKAKNKPAPEKPKPPRIVKQRLPSALWNGMIAPLKGVSFRGVIWYQGEANASRAWQYRRLFRTMIESWRSGLGDAQLPFLYVQLPNFAAREEGTWPELRQAQSEALTLPATGMAVTLDIGTSKNIHPKNKHSVGRRLGLVAEKLVYERDVIAEGPTLRSVKRSSADPEALELSFRFTEGWQPNHEETPILGFEVASDQGAFYPAKATIVAKDKLRVSSPEVKAPKWVRYAWHNDPKSNLKNSAGLPAPPFRTDQRPWKTRRNGQ